MATDIMDKDLKALRDGQLGSGSSNTSEPACDTVNRKATIVIEHDAGIGYRPHDAALARLPQVE
jgi:hypothetical protein